MLKYMEESTKENVTNNAGKVPGKVRTGRMTDQYGRETNL